MKNENKMEDMVDILTHMHQYVPFHADTKTLEVLGAEGLEEVQLQVERLHHLLIGGDQVTAERVKGAQTLPKNSTHAVGRLEGFVPVSEDWHAKVCYLQVHTAMLVTYLNSNCVSDMEGCALLHVIIYGRLFGNVFLGKEIRTLSLGHSHS